MSRLTRWWRRLRRRRFDEQAAIERAELSQPSALAAEDATTDGAGVPIPPPHLRARVGGVGAMRAYLDVGQVVADSVVSRLREADVDVHGLRRVVDFGCGCARILRFLRARMPSASIAGLDVDADAIAWCRANLASIADFRTIPHHPPTAEATGAFDALISISVFTHLPPPMQESWIAEWARLVAPEGVALFSVMHPEDRGRRTRVLKLVSESDGSSYHRVGPQEGHPDWYQAAFHTERAAERLASPYFDVLRIDRRGIGGLQTSVVCRRRAATVPVGSAASPVRTRP